MPPRSRQKTGAYGLLFPAGVSWGSGAFDEGFQHLIVGSKTPQLVDADGKLDLSGEGVKDVFDVYKDADRQGSDADAAAARAGALGRAEV